MINREHKLSVVRQAKLLGFGRGNINYSARLVSDDDLALMRRIDEVHLVYPFAGSRMLQGQFALETMVRCRNRCLVPVTTFAEPNPACQEEGGKVPNAWFARDEEKSLMFFAGIHVPQW